MIAMALAGQPELLIADEPTTALDATIQAQILDLIDRLRREMGMALVLISHDLSVVAELCERIVVMYAGGIVEEAPAERLFSAPAHPYTHGLIGAAPPLIGAQAPAHGDPGPGARTLEHADGLRLRAALLHRGAGLRLGRPRHARGAPGQRAACIRVAERPRASARIRA